MAAPERPLYCQRLRTVADGRGRLRTVADVETTGREQGSTLVC